MSLQCVVQYKFSKFSLTAVIQQQTFLAPTEENPAMVDKLVLGPVPRRLTQIDRSVHPLALSAVVLIIFVTAIWA